MEKDKFLKKLVDPVDHSPLSINDDKAISSKSSYEVKDGIIQLMPSEDDIIKTFGFRNYQSWRELQDEAEKSYAIHSKGHFSIEGYEPAQELAGVLGQCNGEWLDIGCGKLTLPAYYTNFMENKKKRGGIGSSIVGIDPMDINPEEPRQFPFARAMGDFLPFQAGSFDGVLFASSLDHCINPMQALEEASRVLRLNGKLIVQETIRQANDRMQRWAESAKYFQTRYNKNHNWAFDESSLDAVIQMAGFDKPTFINGNHMSERILICKKANVK
jgi:SAM-dependent methyltransferase